MKTSFKGYFAAILAVSVVSLGWAEPKAWQVKAFKEFDVNSNNALELSEFITQRISLAKQAAKKNDRQFDEANWRAFAERLFPKSDTDGDGKISDTEFYASFAAK